MGRTALGIVAVVATTFAIGGPAGASDPQECTFDAGTAVASITPLDGSVLIHHDGETIYVDGAACGTLVTADRIDVTSFEDEVRIVLADGPFAPGKTDEGDGSSEIEFTVTGHVHLSLEGGDGPEHIGAGTHGGAAFNLDTSETTPDIDLLLDTEALRSLSVELGAGNDAYVASGILETRPLAAASVVVRLGPGKDLLAPGFGIGASYLGGAGRDTFTARWVTNCVSTFDVAQRSGTLCDVNGSFGFAGFERIFTTEGTDIVSSGARGSDVIRTFGGDDFIAASLGDDVIDGGPGGDTMMFGDIDRRIHVDLRVGVSTGAGSDRLVRIENVTGSPRGDTLFGDGRANRLWGGGGNDEIWGRGGPDDHSGGDGRDDCHQRDATRGDTFTGCER